MRPIVLDTSVWVEWLRGTTAHLNILLKDRIIFMPAIVELELLSGAVDKRSEKIVESLLKPFRQNRRIVIPSEADYQTGGNSLAELRMSATKMANDAMICVCAKKIGAEVWSYNAKDFSAICKLLNISLLTRSELA